MKPLLLSFCTLLLLVSIWGGFINYSTQILGNLSHQLSSEVYQPVSKENWEEARQEMDRWKALWHKNKTLFYTLSGHSVARETDLAIARASEYIRNQAQTEALAELAVVEELFISIRQGEAFSIDNLF